MSEKQAAFTVVIHGKGGHGSRPFNCINPVDCFAALYGALKSEADAVKPGALRVTRVDGDSKTNIIRDDLRFDGVFLCDTQEQAQRFESRLAQAVDGICAAYRCRGELLSPAVSV